MSFSFTNSPSYLFTSESVTEGKIPETETLLMKWLIGLI